MNATATQFTLNWPEQSSDFSTTNESPQSNLSHAAVLYRELLAARGLIGSLPLARIKVSHFTDRLLSPRLVFDFAEGHLGSFDPDLRGGKGMGLSEMARLGIPGTPGATVLTTASRYFNTRGKLPASLARELALAIESLERQSGLTFGNKDKPLLLSVRSGAPVSMPGMMDTILNVGLNRHSVIGLGQRAGERFAWDSYRRCLAMFGTTVLGADRSLFENCLKTAREHSGVDNDGELSVDQLQLICDQFEKIIVQCCGRAMPENPYEQLALSIMAVLESWDSERAIAYRKKEEISADLGTAVILQAMVFGNKGANSGTGVVFSANPITGEDGLYGEFLANAQGEDVVAGVRTPLSLQGLAEIMPDVYAELVTHVNTLARHYRDMVDVEFTVEDGVLYLLQVRSAKRSREAAINFAVNQVAKGEWIEEDALMSVGFLDDDTTCTFFDQEAIVPALVEGYLQGIPASPQVAVGRLYFSIEKAMEAADFDVDVILARMDTSPDDLPAMLASRAIITSCGGTTSHAAVVARGLHIPAVVGCNFRIEGDQLTFGDGQTISEGQEVSVDGAAGIVVRGLIPIANAEATANTRMIKEWLERTELRIHDAAILPALMEQIWDINQWHNDFYLLSSMAANSKSHPLKDRITTKLKAVESQLAEILTCYLTYAVYTELFLLPDYARKNNPQVKQLQALGELRNCGESTMEKLKKLAARNCSYQEEFFRLASHAFVDSSWSSGFGGRPWSQIAAAPREYLAGRVPASIYIDHVFDLKHNGGVLFNKHRMAEANEHLLQNQLDAKKSISSTDKLFARLTTLHKALDPEVRALYEQGLIAGLWGGCNDNNSNAESGQGVL
ncbi:MAG: hypothetical protein JSS86_07935 [Cyanobacteria bacterium SZAS LIN-2]|nr:hypothetical protein [Cyanobacteria bacterium SZAS LIN-2]